MARLISVLLAWCVATASTASPKQQGSAGDAKAAPAGEAVEKTCGQEMAESAEVPRGWHALMNHVASNMEWHAAWVGADAPSARGEHQALLRVAAAYRAMANSAAGAEEAMASMKDLPPAPHDPTRFDRARQARWMRAKIKMQREFADMLLRHARESEKALSRLESSPGERP